MVAVFARQDDNLASGFLAGCVDNHGGMGAAGTDDRLCRLPTEPGGQSERYPLRIAEHDDARPAHGLVTEKTPGRAALDGPAPCQGGQQQEKIESDGAGEPLVDRPQPLPDRRTGLTLGSGGCICHHAAGHEPL